MGRVTMTDYEMAYIFNDNIIVTLFMSFISIVFAFLVPGNMVVHKLKSYMVSLVVILFTIASSILIFLMNRYDSVKMVPRARIELALPKKPDFESDLVKNQRMLAIINNN
jgi:hypothetical protein